VIVAFSAELKAGIAPAGPELELELELPQPAIAIAPTRRPDIAKTRIFICRPNLVRLSYQDGIYSGVRADVNR
jgi:hypothetical protein